MKMTLLISLLFLGSLDLQAGRELHGYTARQIVQSSLIYAMEHEERLPATIADVPELDSILELGVAIEDIHYLAPYGSTLGLPSNTPIALVHMREQNMIAVGFIGGNVQYFERRPSHLPKGLLEGKNLILAVSVGFNLLLVFLLVICSWGRRKGTPNKSALAIP